MKYEKGPPLPADVYPVNPLRMIPQEGPRDQGTCSATPGCFLHRSLLLHPNGTICAEKYWYGSEEPWFMLPAPSGALSRMKE